MPVRDISPDEFNRSLAKPKKILEQWQSARRGIVYPHTVLVLASYVTSYVAQRVECAFEDAAAMPEQEFGAAAKPLLDFLDARWP
jgi:hypothetical protein